MDPTQRLQIANRIHIDLMREMGQGIDLRQMLDSELYARDVLLVCQAFSGHELQQLGEAFSRSGHHSDRHDDASANAQSTRPLATTTAAGHTVPRPIGASLGALVGVVAPLAQTALDSRWLHPSRWFVD